MTGLCKTGFHKMHFNGVLWVCRRCGAWQKDASSPINPPPSHDSPQEPKP